MDSPVILVDSVPADSLPAQIRCRSIALVGLMGAGKTNVGRRLAARLALPFHDTDIEIERDAGCSVPELFARYGETDFRDRERRVIRRLLADAPSVLATGGGAFMDPRTRKAIQQQATSIWLRCDLPLLLRRLTGSTNRPLLQNGDPVETLQQLIMQRHPIYGEADLVVDGVDESPDVTTAKVLAVLRTWTYVNS